MNHLDLYDVLAVAARVMRCDPDAAIRRTELEVVAQVLSEMTSPQRSDELAEASATLLSGLVRKRPFDGPNRTIAVALALQLAALNGADLELEPVDELDELLDRVKEARIAVPEVADVLRGRLRPRDRTAVMVSRFGEEQQIHPEEIGMFERFSERARRVMVLAQEEARTLQHNYIGTEHVLLAILTDGGGGAAKVLADCGLSAAAVRALVLEIVGRGDGAQSGHIPFTPRAKRVLEYSLREGLELGSAQLGTEHLLLGIIRDGEGVAAQALIKLGADLPKVRRQVISSLEHRRRAESAVAGFLAEGAEHSGNFSWETPGRRHHLLGELKSLLDENERLHREVVRLRDKLRHHEIDPDA
jgi:prophage maintenance system killer protein